MFSARRDASKSTLNSFSDNLKIIKTVYKTVICLTRYLKRIEVLFADIFAENR